MEIRTNQELAQEIENAIEKSGYKKIYIWTIRNKKPKFKKIYT